MANHLYRSLGLALGIGMICAVQPSASHALGASYDCAKAATTDERAVCADPYLSALDGTYANAFAWARDSAGSDAALPIARSLRQQRASCGSDGACIERAYRDALAAFARMGVEPEIPRRADYVGAPLPYVIGACSQTTIVSIGPRLDGDPAFTSGTGVRYANGGTQVSYDKEAALIASRIGDPVELCLIEIPKDCPPGDTRGKVYKGRNLRTGGVWVMPDAAHGCGGA